MRKHFITPSMIYSPVYPVEKAKVPMRVAEITFVCISVLNFLHTIGVKTTTAQIGGRYFGFVNGGLLPVAHAAGWIADT